MGKKKLKIKKKAPGKKMAPVNKYSDMGGHGTGGAHWHQISENPEMTRVDGEHNHLFIINGLPVFSNHDGEHSHPVSASANRTGAENQNHTHTVKVAGTIFTTGTAGAHIHELSSAHDTNHSGYHRHTLTIDDGVEVQSLMPGDLLQASVRKRVALEIQSVHISSLLFPDEQEAVQFVEERGFIGRDIQKLEDGFRFRQLSRERFQESTLKEIELSNGVKAIVGVLDPDKMGDANQTLDSLKDINPAEELMREEQVAALSRLKDAYAGMVVDMKEKATKFIPILNQFVDLSDEFVKNEPFQVFLTEFLDSFNVLQAEIDRIDTPAFETKSEKRLHNFEDYIRGMEPVLKSLSDLFYQSDDFDNFGRVLKKNHVLFKQMILNLPVIREKGSGTPIEKAYNDFIDFENITDEELEHFTPKEICSLNIKDMDLEKLRSSESLNSTLAAVLKKVVGTDNDEIRISLGHHTEPDWYQIDKRSSETSSLCYNLDKGIPLPIASVDKLWCADFITSLEDRVQIMEEAARVLKDGGEFVVRCESTDGQRAFLPCNKSLWNAEVFKFFGEGDSSKFEIVEIKTQIEEDDNTAISATLSVQMKRRSRS
jgi:hypothetical protein